MQAYNPNSLGYLAIAMCTLCVSGCASDGGVGELAVVGLVIGAASMDSGTLMAAAAVGTGLMVAASISGTDEAKTPPPSTVSPAVAVAVAPASLVAPQPVSSPIAEPAKPTGGRLSYCYAYLTVGETAGSTCSPVVELNDSDGTGSVFQTRVDTYVAKVKQSQPGIWGDFEYAQTLKMQNAFIYQMKPKAGSDASKQDAGLICYVSRSDADAQLKRSQKNDSSLKIVSWP